MIFTPDERRALLFLSILFSLGFLAHLIRIGSPESAGTGDSLLVVLAEQSAVASSEPPPGLLEDGKLWINEADQNHLRLLPGIGPVLAERIAEDRSRNGPYRSWRDLIRVRGIGEKTARRLERFASFRQPTLETAADCTDSLQSATPSRGVPGKDPGN
jgi:hypothetical protein